MLKSQTWLISLNGAKNDFDFYGKNDCQLGEKHNSAWQTKSRWRKVYFAITKVTLKKSEICFYDI